MRAMVSGGAGQVYCKVGAGRERARTRPVGGAEGQWAWREQLSLAWAAQPALAVSLHSRTLTGRDECLGRSVPCSPGCVALACSRLVFPLAELSPETWHELWLQVGEAQVQLQLAITATGEDSPAPPGPQYVSQILVSPPINLSAGPGRLPGGPSPRRGAPGRHRPLSPGPPLGRPGGQQRPLRCSAAGQLLPADQDGLGQAGPGLGKHVHIVRLLGIAQLSHHCLLQ